jgi:ribulose 1,5-bisphosphate synthetase/thiazole synthase
VLVFMKVVKMGLAAFAVWAATAAAVALAETEYHKYIIVGAGPGGLQLGHYLESAGRDYLVLEQSDTAASFFVKYPRWRQLIR